MPEDLKLSQIGSSQLPPPLRGLHSPGVRKHCQIIFACYFRKSSILCTLCAPSSRAVSLPLFALLLFGLFWKAFIRLFLLFSLTNITIIEHASTPVPAVDNKHYATIRVQVVSSLLVSFKKQRVFRKRRRRRKKKQIIRMLKRRAGVDRTGYFIDEPTCWNRRATFPSNAFESLTEWAGF